MRVFRRLLVALALLALVWWLLSPGAGPSVEPGSVLVLDLGGEYVEAAEPPLLSRVLGDRRRTFASLLSELRKAERDDRLAGVVLRIRPLQTGWAKAQEIRESIRRIGEAGRQTVAYLELEALGANLEYYVATAAQRIVVAPGTRAPVVGLAAEYLFLGGLWEKLGVGLEVERVGRYKSFAETLSAKQMSEPHREMASSLLDSIDAQFVSGIAESRGIDEKFVRNAIDSAPASGSELLALGLSDGTSFLDEITASIGTGEVIEGDRYARVDPSSVGFAPVARFALVYGSGNVVSGRGSSSPMGNPVLASETVGEALRDAAEDDEIDAIILRVDSPGGSALASDVVWHATQRARAQGKPLIASFSDVAASGGYYVACGADEIVAGAGTLTGSIGVFTLRPVLGGLLDKLGIGAESMTRGKHADLLLASRPLSEASRAHVRREVEGIYELFVSRVAEGRDLEAARVDELGRGRVWTGQQAVELGLLDGIGGLGEAARRARVALGLDPDADVELVPYPRPRSLAEQVDEALRRLVWLAAPSLPRPRLVARLEAWLDAAPVGAPVLLPPLVLEIR